MIINPAVLTFLATAGKSVNADIQVDLNDLVNRAVNPKLAEVYLRSLGRPSQAAELYTEFLEFQQSLEQQNDEEEIANAVYALFFGDKDSDLDVKGKLNKLKQLAETIKKLKV